MEQNTSQECMLGMDDVYKKQVEAYVDGELSLQQEKRMRETMKHFPQLRAYANKIRHQRAFLKLWWAENKNMLH